MGLHLGILTGGGDCPGLNAVIRAATLALLARGARVTGIERGFHGLMRNRMRALEAADVADILDEGGTVLGTHNRADPFHDLEHGGADRSDEVLAHARARGLDAVLAIGGDGTMDIAARLHARGLPVIGVPKTIDNDLPHTERTFGFDSAVAVAAEAIGRQTYRMRISTEGFRAELARARTFTMAEDVTRLRAAGLALGGGLHNAVVVDGALVLNPGGLRFADEFVRHKLLDVVGDLALAGGRILGRFRGHRTGHALNNKLLHALLADRANWAWTAAPAIADGMSMPLAAVAAPA